MDRSYNPDLEKILSRLEDAHQLTKELEQLRIANPDSPRISVLEKQRDSVVSTANRDLERNREELQKSRETVERAERLSFDVQRQLTTLSATLIVALLALSEVFDGTPGLRVAVGEASSNLIYAIGASLMTMVVYGLTSLDYSVLRVTEDAPWYERAVAWVLPKVGMVVTWLHIILSGLSLWFFFAGLLTLAAFLSSD